MEINVKITGYYRRERDGNEYIHYLIGEEEHLTNGIHDWSNKNDPGRIRRYMKQLIKVEEINVALIKERLKKHIPYHLILGIDI